MKETNKKLAEFAGFKIQQKILGKGGYKSTDVAPWPMEFEWKYPNGKGHDNPPDFTDPVWGIAHLFRWVMPELRKRGMDYELYGWQNDEHKAIIKTRSGHWGKEVCSYIDKYPSQALANAILKVIEATR